jgi:hypothetical protein
LAATGVAIQAPAQAASSARIAPVFPFCAWPVESTPALANEAGPDPNATYWTTPFKTSSGFTSLTIEGRYPTARFASFTVYDNGGDTFTQTVNGKTVTSALADYRILPDAGSVNPWRVATVPPGRRTTFTVRLRRHVTLFAQQHHNALPMVDTGPPPAKPVAPSDIGFVTFRTYIPSGGNTTVALPKIIVNRRVSVPSPHRAPAFTGRAYTAATKATHTVLPTCNATRIAHAVKVSKALKKLVGRIQHAPSTTDQVTACTINGQPRYTNGCAPSLQWVQASSAQIGALFPNPSNAYISMSFHPAPGTVVVTRGRMPTSPKAAGHGALGDSIGAVPVNWTASPLPYQVRYWSVNNYLIKEPYPVVTEGAGPNRTYGGTADYQTAVDGSGRYTVVSSLPADKPTASTLAANTATWIAMQGDQPNVAETQWMRNMLSNYPNAIQNIPPASSPTEYVTGPIVAQTMGAYYPRSAQCSTATFATGGADACFAAARR